MNASDLRIGNLFYKINRTQKVHMPIEVPMVVAEIGIPFVKFYALGTPIEQVTKYFDVELFSMTPIPLTEEWLVNKFIGFTKRGIILASYSIDISWNKNEFREITVTIESGNQYVYLRSGELNKPREKDDVITIFNGDYHGKLYVHTLQNIYQTHAFKELTLNN
jgi:hypothetical protein